MRSEERCKPLSPCCRVVGDRTFAVPPCRSGSPWGDAEPVPLGTSSAFSEVGGGGCRLPSAASARSCCTSPSLRSPFDFRALRSFRLLSYSRSWPRKLKLGEMDGRRSLTNLPRGTDSPSWCLVLQQVTPILSASLGRRGTIQDLLSRPSKERSLGEPQGLRMPQGRAGTASPLLFTSPNHSSLHAFYEGRFGLVSLGHSQGNTEFQGALTLSSWLSLLSFPEVKHTSITPLCPTGKTHL